MEEPPPFSLLTEEEPFSLEESLSFTLSSLVLTENQTSSLSHEAEVKKKKKKKKKKRNKKEREGADLTAENEVANPFSPPSENQTSSLSHEAEVKKKKKKKKKRNEKKREGADSTAENEVANPFSTLSENQTSSLSHQTEVKKKRNKKKREGADSTAENEVANPLSRSFSFPRTHLPGSLLTKMDSKVDSILRKANQYSSTVSDEIDELVAIFDEASKILQKKMNETVRSIKSKRATVSREKTPDHIRNRLCSEVDSLVQKLNLILLDVASYESMKRGITASPYIDELREIDFDILEGDVTEPDVDLQVSFEDALAEAKMDTKLMEKLGNLKFGK